jgi:hypothetical protein
MEQLRVTLRVTGTIKRQKSNSVSLWRTKGKGIIFWFLFLFFCRKMQGFCMECRMLYFKMPLSIRGHRIKPSCLIFVDFILHNMQSNFIKKEVVRCLEKSVFGILVLVIILRVEVFAVLLYFWTRKTAKSICDY